MAAELAENMDQFLGIGRPKGFAAHHLVSHSVDYPEAKLARDLCCG
jgi:hypothetical protein